MNILHCLPKLSQPKAKAVIYNIRHRTKRSKGGISRNGILHMTFKLGQCAEQTKRKLRGFETLAKAIIGVKFKHQI